MLSLTLFEMSSKENNSGLTIILIVLWNNSLLARTRKTYNKNIKEYVKSLKKKIYRGCPRSIGTKLRSLIAVIERMKISWHWFISFDKWNLLIGNDVSYLNDNYDISREFLRNVRKFLLSTWETSFGRSIRRIMTIAWLESFELISTVFENDTECIFQSVSIVFFIKSTLSRNPPTLIDRSPVTRWAIINLMNRNKSWIYLWKLYTYIYIFFDEAIFGR